VGGEVRSVVAADELGVASSRADDLVEGGDSGVGVDGVLDHIGQRLASELIDHVQQFDDPARGGDVELVVERPHLVRSLRLKSVGWCARHAEALAFALRRHPETSSRHTRWTFLRFTR
jgi:hypothetical protein